MDKLLTDLLKKYKSTEEILKKSQVTLEALTQQLNCFENKLQHGNGICSAFVLDTSESMAGEGFRQMKKAVFDILDEYSALNLDDNVAVIACGAETKVLHYFSNDYTSIKKCFKSIDCIGPPQLEAGIDLTLSCIKHRGGGTVYLHPLEIRPRVVVISNGNPADKSDPKETTTNSKTFQRLFSLAEREGKVNPFTFIPVGNSPNYCLLGALAIAAKGGRLIGWKEARQYARLSLNFRVAGKLLSQFRGETLTEDIVRTRYSSFGHGDEDDINQVCEILNEKEVYGKLCKENKQKQYASMPSIGTRVRRGEDWQYGNQDSYGVGTVTGHCDKAGWIFVEWDNGQTFDYRYGNNGLMEAYDLTVCDEPRHIPENQTIATGCLVRRGYDWQWGDQDGSEESIGTVYRVEGRGEVYVIWPNGVKSNYRFGYKNKYDLLLCDPRDPEIMQLYQFQKEMFSDKNSTSSENKQ